jgi:hypothetical protein
MLQSLLAAATVTAPGIAAAPAVRTQTPATSCDRAGLRPAVDAYLNLNALVSTILRWRL